MFFFQLEPGCSVLLNHKVHAIVGVLSDDTDPMVTVMKLEKAPQETYADIGGLDTQIQEIKESVELPLTHPEYYEEMGIKPPKGVILYGAPGTGKTLLAKAVANQTSATFLRVVGSELIQKYLVSYQNFIPTTDLSLTLVFDRVMVQNWYESYSELLKNTLRLLCLSTKLMPLVPNVMTRILEVSARSSVLCWSYWTSWTVSIPGAMLR